MKNVIFLSALAIVMVLTSCKKEATVVATENAPDITVGYVGDTTIMVEKNETSPISLCVGGWSKFKKIVRTFFEAKTISYSGNVKVSAKMLEDSGWVYKPAIVNGPNGADNTKTIHTKKSSFWGFNGDWLTDLLKLLALLAILAITAALLGGLITRLFHKEESRFMTGAQKEKAISNAVDKASLNGGNIEAKEEVNGAFEIKATFTAPQK